MKKILIFIFLLNISHLLESLAYGQDKSDEFEYYRKLNNSETRLSEYKDDDKALRLKLAQLAVINQSREKFRVQEVKLDILASRVANRQCREAAENGFISHWNLEGEKPYQRYAFAGGVDHVAENAFGEWSSDDYDNPANVIPGLMKTGHVTFMKEKAPYDGHKKNIINKSHNYVGIGFYLTKNQFRYYEEFIDRYVEFIDIPNTLEINESGKITVDTKGNCYLFFMTIYREKLLKPIKAQQLMHIGSYDDYSDEIALNVPAWNLAKYRHGNIYTIPVKFSKEGLYYIHLYIDKKENTGSTSITTKGKEPVSGIVIKVSR